MKNRKSIATLDFSCLWNNCFDPDRNRLTDHNNNDICSISMICQINQAYIKNKIGSTIHFSNLVLASAVGIK